MTVFLNRTVFKPALILASVVGGFFFLLFLILTIAVFHVILLIITLLIVVLYGGVLAGAYWLSRSEKYYLKEHKQGIEIRYPTMNYGRGVMKIPYKAIVGFEFYSMNTKEGWLNLFNRSALPDCVYITYINRYGKIVTELMGYITQADAQALAQRYNVKFTLQ